MNSYKKYVEMKKTYLNFKHYVASCQLPVASGGMVEQNDILKKIKSIGFEFETDKMAPLKKVRNINTHQKNILTGVGIGESYELLNNKNENEYEHFKLTIDTPSGSSSVYSINYFLNNQHTYSDAVTKQDKIIYYFKNVDNFDKIFKHVEFHMTYTNIKQNSNVIYHYLEKSCKMISEYFKTFYLEKNLKIENIYTNEKRIFNENDLSILNKLNISNEMPNVITNHALIYENSDDDILYMIPNTNGKINDIDDVHWVVQTTLGILLEDVVDVINYLEIINDNNNQPNTNWKKSVENCSFIMNYFINTYLNNSNIYDHVEIVKMQNFITIIMYETNFMVFHPEYDHWIIDKYLYSFAIRHKYYEIIPNVSFYEQFKIFMTNYSPLYLSEYGTNLFYELIYELLNNNRSFIAKKDENSNIIYNLYGKEIGDDIENHSVKYPYENGIVLIEFRSFYKHLQKEAKKIGIETNGKMSIKKFKLLFSEK